MGVNLKEIIIKQETSLSELAGKKLVIDGNNILYQFLSTIRQPDGTLLMDSHGNITSHLNGLFHRTTKLMHYGIKPVFVFDGAPPELKKAERERRADIKRDALEHYETAKREGDIENMKKYSQRTSRLTSEMINDAKLLLDAMGLPVVQAPSEGEAQAAYLVKRGDVFAEISQDYDCLLFGVPRMIQNLTISERKKIKDKLSYETVKPQLIELDANLKSLNISHDQLIVLGILVGTDYNVGGIKGVGPKKALELLKKFGEDFNSLFSELNWYGSFDYSWKDVFNLFKQMSVEKNYELSWTKPDSGLIIDFLCNQHGFSLERVKDTLEKLNKAQANTAQKGLGDFFGRV